MNSNLPDMLWAKMEMGPCFHFKLQLMWEKKERITEVTQYQVHNKHASTMMVTCCMPIGGNVPSNDRGLHTVERKQSVSHVITQRSNFIRVSTYLSILLRVLLIAHVASSARCVTSFLRFGHLHGYVAPKQGIDLLHVLLQLTQEFLGGIRSLVYA